MKLNTLMLDDMVLLWHQRFNAWIPITVTIDILKSVKEDEIKPIDLTPEMLENNDFTKRDAIPGIISWKEWVSSDGRVILCNKQDFINSDNTWAIHIDNEDMETIGAAELSFLHQLQHILKHYEIEHKEFIVQL